MPVLIFANGEMDDMAWIRPYLAQATAVIAADGGARHLLALHRPPDVVIGDMDSLPEPARHWLSSSGARFITHPAAKDETDLELALLYAAVHFKDDVWVFGGWGGRLDQSLANVLLLAHPDLQGRFIQFVEPGERIWLIQSKTVIHGRPGDTISLLPLGGHVHVDSTSGLRWPLQNELLILGRTRGVSNELTAEVATVQVRSGRLLCIHRTI
ncbi:MAG: thiamine diphosphokinase [Chloroflexota bacterium]